MHEPLLAQAALPEPVACFGLMLRPFSLGHELALVRSENPLSIVSPGETVTREDLAAAAYICCQPWAEISGKTRSRFLFAFKQWAWRRRTRNLDFDAELAAFKVYQLQHSAAFPPSEVRRAGVTYARQSGSPYLLVLHQFIVERLKLSEDQAWDYPLGLAKMRRQASLEEEGKIEIKNQQEADFDAYVAREEAKECQA